tara:strand:- start:34 stop:228 length:195 start_codon:yes stop_codon:yes gene_type:complete
MGKEEMMTEYFDITPDTRGLIRWLGEVAKTDRPTAMKILVEGWPMSVKQAEEILDRNSREVTGE